jgi:hypothetical protein
MPKATTQPSNTDKKMCQKTGFVKRIFVVLNHSPSRPITVAKILPPLPKIEQMYRNNSVKKEELGLPQGDPYTLVPLELPLSWIQSIPPSKPT